MKTKTTKNNLPLKVVQSIDSCCSTTDDGVEICIVPKSGSASTCGCKGADKEETTESTSESAHEQTNLRGKIRSVILFGVACLASPCCTPLFVPLFLVFLAGTPAAVWLSVNIGWVYGALTILSIISFVLAIRWWPKLSGKQKPQTAVSVEPHSVLKTN